MKTSNLLVLLPLLGGCQPPVQTQGTPTPPPATATPTPAPVTPNAPLTVTEAPVQVIVTSASTASMVVEVKDANFEPVRTDVWFYKLDGDKLVPLSGVDTPGYKRRSNNAVLPATVMDASTSYAPADDGGNNGLMTDGSDRTAIKGRVTVLLPGGITAGTKILVAAAIEDQRYYGAKVVELPSGTMSDAPAFNTALTHKRRSYETDVKSIIQKTCLECHTAGGKASRMPMLTWNDIVLNNFGGESGASTEYMIEPGSPALSAITRRARPGVGTTAKLWYGKGGYRWAFDGNGNIIGDRRMPPQSIAGQSGEDDGPQSYFDTHLDEYKILYDWISQGAPQN